MENKLTMDVESEDDAMVEKIQQQQEWAEADRDLLDVIEKQQMEPNFKSKWEHVDHSTAFTSQGGTRVSTWRLQVPNGWLYKVTEWDDENHFAVQVCFAPDSAASD